MIKIERPNSWMKGKTVKMVYTNYENCTKIVFTDGTACLIEAEQMGFGFIGPVYYEVPTKTSKKRKVA